MTDPVETGKCSECGFRICEGTDHLCMYRYSASLRDQFAKALLPAVWVSTTTSPEAVAAKCYEVADAMMAARESK